MTDSRSLPAIIGAHPAVRHLRRRIPDIASGTNPLIIVGKTGVGKTLVAAHIHALSPFRHRAMEVIDAATLDDGDLRVALQGGGFADLSTTRRSVLELPTTLFFRNIDRAPGYLQESLAQAIVTSRLARPGERIVRTVRARVVIGIESRAGVLCARGCIVPSLARILRSSPCIDVPSLGRRKDDIPLLVTRFLGKRPDPALCRLLRDRCWRENILELKAYLRSICVRSHEESLRQFERVQVEKMIMLIEEGNPFSMQHTLRLIESGLVDRALHATDGNKTRAARLLGLSRRTLQRHLSILA